MKEFKVDNHASSFLPENSDWKLVWSDEFDGDKLDTTKWDIRLNMMGKRCKHWTDDAYYLDANSNIVFTIVKKDGVYCTTQLETGHNYMDMPANESLPEDSKEKNVEYFEWRIGEIREPKFMHKYGYYECRCKMQKEEGWWSAFWLQSPVIGSTLNPKVSGVEVDIMEGSYKDKSGNKNIITHNNHWNGYGKQHGTTGTTEYQLKPTEDEYHIIGCEWSPDGYTYYVDGVKSGHFNGPVSDIEQFILISTEAIGYRSSSWNAWDDLEKAYKKKDKWIVDYVRVFDKKE